MSNQEPDGWYFDAKNVRHFHSQFEVARIGSLCAGTTPVPFNSIDPQELTRLRLIAEWAKECRENMREVGKQFDHTDDPLGFGYLCDRYEAITAPVEAKPEPKMHTDAFGQPLIGRAKQ